jgi:gluconate:H+ symporter, GntP family
MTTFSTFTVPMAFTAGSSATQKSLSSHDIQVLVVAAIGIAIVVLLIVWLRVHAFIDLVL